MKRNPLIPYALIAIVGILAVIVIAFVGNDQRKEIAGGDESGQEEAIMENPEEIYEASCVACHGADLSGGMGPALSAVGAELSVDEIKEIITNGKGQMPPQSGTLKSEEIEIISKWLSEKK
ncbi:cytochrome c550 [Ornithinibacillus scapharcae]|uniref:cytochrome c550 n=1 Tax=Ornithinibacillus scapharcae TaxID=1147159 RepID=UPI000225B397|nr:cytochrome c [Ornithinibacillus scapharcae]